MLEDGLYVDHWDSVMGGLACRRFISAFPQHVERMNDTTGKGSGGRLIKLGTPNRGSFSIRVSIVRTR
jgi:hypothetical protein